MKSSPNNLRTYKANPIDYTFKSCIYLSVRRNTLKREKGLNAELLICENKTFGATVTVTGLLCGKDFAVALERSQSKGPVLIPPNSLNKENLFLDDMRPSDLEQRFGRKVMIPNSFREYFPH